MGDVLLGKHRVAVHFMAPVIDGAGVWACFMRSVSTNLLAKSHEFGRGSHVHTDV
jgi:hypothetical protein